MDRMALTLNLSCGQVGVDLEFMLVTDKYRHGICLVDSLILTWNLHCKQDGFDLEFTLWAVGIYHVDRLA